MTRPETPPLTATSTDRVDNKVQLGDNSQIDHQSPSLPSSPLPKRVKTMAEQPITATTSAAPAPLDSAPAAAAVPLLIKTLTPEAQVPTRGSAFAAGYDLYSSAATTIPARGKALVSTGLAIAVPPGTYGRVAPRSGLASKHHIDTGAGVIDADYRGEVKVLLFNHAETEFVVSVGERVAQLVLEKIVTPEIVQVEELEASVRGAGGFGSTGTGK